jgi:hypothetical protein
MRLPATNISCKPVSRCCSRFDSSDRLIGTKCATADSRRQVAAATAPETNANHLMIRVHSCAFVVKEVALGIERGNTARFPQC